MSTHQHCVLTETYKLLSTVAPYTEFLFCVIFFTLPASCVSGDAWMSM